MVTSTSLHRDHDLYFMSKALDDTLRESLQELLCVRVVCLHGPDVLRLPHILTKIQDFLDWSSQWTITKACSSNLLYLTRRLIAQDMLEPGDSGKRDAGYRQWQFSRGMTKAVTFGNLELVKLLSTFFTGCAIPAGIVDHAANLGQLETLQWLVAHRGDMLWSSAAVTAAIEGGHLEMAKWLERMTPGGCINNDDVRSAGITGNLELLKWVCSRSKDNNPWVAVQNAANQEHLDMVTWIREQDGYDLLGESCLFASNKMLDITKLDENVEEDPGFAIDAAASGGLLDVVKGLHGNSSGGCTVDAIDKAAEHGHLDVVKWLSGNRTEGCTTKAMDLAAANGHLDVIIWLHFSRLEGCTVDAVNKAAGNGHLAVVKWLLANRPEGCATAAMENAAMQGQLDVVRWLHHHRREDCSSRAIHAAVLHRHFDVAWFLHQTDSRCDIASVLRYCPETERRWEFVDWMYMHHPGELQEVWASIFAL